MRQLNALIGALVTFLFLSTNSYSQVIIGPKIGYNTYQQQPGFGLQAGIIAGDKIKASLEVMGFSANENYETIINPSYSTSSQTNSFTELNFNFSYLFKFDRAYVYPLIGMNIANVSHSFHYYDSNVGTINSESSISKVGFNIGAGAQYNLGLISPFVEAKYSISDVDNATVGAGVLFNIGRKKFASK